MEEFSLGQQVIINVNGQDVRGTITRSERSDNDERVYYVSSEDSAEHGPFTQDQVKAG